MEFIFIAGMIVGVIGSVGSMVSIPLIHRRILTRLMEGRTSRKVSRQTLEMTSLMGVLGFAFLILVWVALQNLFWHMGLQIHIAYHLTAIRVLLLILTSVILYYFSSAASIRIVLKETIPTSIKMGTACATGSLILPVVFHTVLVAIILLSVPEIHGQNIFLDFFRFLAGDY